MSQYFLVSKNIRHERGGWAGITFFRRKFFVSLPKNYVGEPFNLSLISAIENFYMLKGVMSRFSVDFVSSHSTENFVGQIFCV